MDLMMEKTDILDKCHDERQSPLKGEAEQRHRERTYLISGGFCFLFVKMGRVEPVEN